MKIQKLNACLHDHIPVVEKQLHRMPVTICGVWSGAWGATVLHRVCGIEVLQQGPGAEPQ